MYSNIKLQLNFCRYRHAGFSYVSTTTNVQVPGFTDDDTYSEVVERGARDLAIKTDIDELQLAVSGGVVNDCPLQGEEQWTLGRYVEEIGGQAVRGKKTGKKTFGIYLPVDEVKKWKRFAYTVDHAYPACF